MTEASTTTHSAAGTRALAGALAEVVRTGDVVILAGELGAGKTTFTQGFAAALGVEEQVTSPTFALVRHYRCAGRPAATDAAAAGDAAAPTPVRTVLHADVYRLDRLAEVADLGLTQLVEDGAVALVEWGDMAMPVLGADPLTVQLQVGPGDDDRRVTVTAPGPRWVDRSGAVVDAVRRGEPWGGSSS